MITPEKMGEMVAADIVRNPSFQNAIDELFSYFVDNKVFEVANDLVDSFENESPFAVNFPDTDQGESDEIEFKMTLIGDLERAIIKSFIAKLKEY